MENEEDQVVVPQDDAPPVTDPAPVVDVAELQAKLKKEEEARRQLTARAQKAEADKKAAEAKLAARDGGGLAVEEYIDISTSLDGLDMREKAFLAEQHKLTGKPLSEIRGGEDFQLWDSAYRAKLEKENALKPNTAQTLEDVPRTLNDRLRMATSLAEKEEILKGAGLYRDPRRRTDSAPIGVPRSH